MKRIHLSYALFLSLLLVAGIAHAETTFVTDKLEIELYSSTFQRGIVVTKVKTGAIVEVIESDGDFRKVRTQDGQEGWLHSKYLSTEKPTQVNYLQLMAKHQLLEQELQQLREQGASNAEMEKQKAVLAKIRNDLKQAKKTIGELRSDLKTKTTQLESAKQELTSLQAQQQATSQQVSNADEATASEMQSAEATPVALDSPVMSSSLPVSRKFNMDYPVAFKWLLTAMLLSVLLGSYLGYSWLDKKIAKRHGGVRIR